MTRHWFTAPPRLDRFQTHLQQRTRGLRQLRPPSRPAPRRHPELAFHHCIDAHDRRSGTVDATHLVVHHPVLRPTDRYAGDDSVRELEADQATAASQNNGP